MGVEPTTVAGDLPRLGPDTDHRLLRPHRLEVGLRMPARLGIGDEGDARYVLCARRRGSVTRAGILQERHGLADRAQQQVPQVGD